MTASVYWPSPNFVQPPKKGTAMMIFARMRRHFRIAALALVVAGNAAAAERDETAITIYSSALPGAIPAEMYRPVAGRGAPNAMDVPGYALVRQDRSMQLAAARSTVRFTDVAALIDPTTVTFSSLTDPHTRVLGQNFQFDLVSTEKLLLKYIDRPITVERAEGQQAVTVSGTLLSAVNGIVLKANDGTIQALNGYSAVRFGELPGGLITKPTLVWDLDAPRGGEQRARITYQTAGVTWWADYNLIFNDGKDANSGLLDLSAWVSIINASGASYPDARLKLIAGDVHRVQNKSTAIMARRSFDAVAAAEVAPGFEEKSFFEFHLYTLGRRTTLPDNSAQQLELFEDARQIPAKKILLYYGAQGSYSNANPITDRNMGTVSNRKVDVYLEFRNDKQHGLGMPLPAGRIRVSKLDAADGAPEFIGEDQIGHTPKDENVRVKLGSAFDVVGERRQVDFTVDTKARWMEEEIEIKLRNHKEQPVEVLVKETLYRGGTWKILSKSQDFVTDDAHSIHFPVTVAKDGESVVRYRVRYTW
jgi:hypothetical protein